MTAVYRCYNEAGALMYVGIADNLGQRLRRHDRDAPWWNDVASIRIERYEERADALAAERRTIRMAQPIYNKIARIPEILADPAYRDRKQIIAYFALSSNILARLMREGLPYERIEGRPIFHLDTVEKWMGDNCT